MSDVVFDAVTTPDDGNDDNTPDGGNDPAPLNGNGGDDDADSATKAESGEKGDTGSASATTKTITSVLAFAMILTGITSVSSVAADEETTGSAVTTEIDGSAMESTAEVTTAETELTAPVPGMITETVKISGKGSIDITVEYTIVPHAVVEVLKKDKNPSDRDESNNPQVRESQIVEGAGPLTGHNIYVGENGFMFYGDAINDYTGESVTTTPRVNRLVDMMNDRDAWAKENGIKLYLVIAPNKSSVYGDYVPESVTPAEKTNMDVLVEALKADSTV